MPFNTDPAFAALVATMHAPGVPAGGFTDYKVARQRVSQGAAMLNPPMPADVESEDFHTPVKDGSQILLRWFRKKAAATAPGPALLHIHGGGMIAGNVADMSGGCAAVVASTGVPMLSVDYRLAPENKGTGLVEDCYAGLQWLVKHAAELHVDPQRIGVMGESAGGGLAAGLAILALRNGGPKIAKQILIYPMFDDRIDEVPHLPLEKLVWSHLDNEAGWKYVLDDQYRASNVDPAAVANRITDATGLPPLYLDIGEEDIFRDSCLQYATKHWLAGISAELHVYPGVGHGWDYFLPNQSWTLKAAENRARAIASI